MYQSGTIICSFSLMLKHKWHSMGTQMTLLRGQFFHTALNKTLSIWLGTQFTQPKPELGPVQGFLTLNQSIKQTKNKKLATHNNLPWIRSCWPAYRIGIYSNPLINGLMQHTFKINSLVLPRLPKDASKYV